MILVPSFIRSSSNAIPWRPIMVQVVHHPPEFLTTNKIQSWVEWSSLVSILTLLMFSSSARIFLPNKKLDWLWLKSSAPILKVSLTVVSFGPRKQTLWNLFLKQCGFALCGRLTYFLVSCPLAISLLVWLQIKFWPCLPLSPRPTSLGWRLQLWITILPISLRTQTALHLPSHHFPLKLSILW